jgi:hypothetical protein
MSQFACRQEFFDYVFLNYVEQVEAMTKLIFILGDEGDGKGTYLKCMERYDRGRRRWFPMASMHEKRASFGCAALGTFIYVMGGYDGTFWLRTVER